LLHREHFGTVARLWECDQLRSKVEARRFLKAWYQETADARYTWKLQVVLGARSKKAFRSCSFMAWEALAVGLRKSRLLVEEHVQAMLENRNALTYVTAFVCWRHTVRKFVVENAKVQVVRANCNRNKVVVVIKRIRRRLSIKCAWLRLVCGWKARRLFDSRQVYHKQGELESSVRSSLDLVATARLFSAWKHSRSKAVMGNMVACQQLNRCFAFWRYLLLCKRRNAWKTKSLHMKSWNKLLGACISYESKLKCKALSTLHKEVLSVHLLHVFRMWREHVQSAVAVSQSIIVSKFFRGWKKRKDQNRYVHGMYRTVLFIKFVRNIFHAWNGSFRRLMAIDAHGRSCLVRRAFGGWYHRTFCEQPRLLRSSNRMVRRCSFNLLQKSFLKWIAIAACTHKWRVRCFMTKKKFSLRWMGYHLYRRTKNQRLNKAVIFRDRCEKHRILRSLHANLLRAKYVDSVISKNFNNQWIMRRIWSFWHREVRPVIQDAIRTDKMIERFRNRSLCQKALHVLMVHKVDHKLKRLESLSDRQFFAGICRRIYGKGLINRFKENLIERDNCETIKRKHTGKLFGIWKANFLAKRDWRTLLSNCTVRLNFLRFKRNIKALHEARCRLYRNLRFKFFELWLQYVCQKLVEKSAAQKIEKALIRSAFVRLEEIFRLLQYQHRIVQPRLLSRTLRTWKVQHSNLMQEAVRDSKMKNFQLRQRLRALKEATMSEQLRKRKEIVDCVEFEQKKIKRTLALVKARYNASADRDRMKAIRTMLLSSKVVRRWRLFVLKRRAHKEERLRHISVKVEIIKRHLVNLRDG
jgi:hypothetical protein